ncbi:MAG: signal peptidase I, partial [Bacteroidota bacterium]
FTVIYYYYNIWWFFYFSILILLVFSDLRTFLKKSLTNNKELAHIMLLLVFFSLTIRILGYLIFTNFHPIDGVSMQPTIQDCDVVTLSKYHQQPINRNSIISFFDVSSKKKLIKRVVAVPGDTIYFFASNELIVNDNKGKKYKWLKDRDKDSTTLLFYNKIGFYPRDSIIVIPPNKYYVIGDNAEYSTDSRIFGLVNDKNIYGTVTKIIWPLSRIKKLQ